MSPLSTTRHPPQIFPPPQQTQIVELELASLEPLVRGPRLTHWTSRDHARQAICSRTVSTISASTVRRRLPFLK